MGSKSDTGDVDRWLGALGLGEHADLFREHRIDAESLPELTDSDLREMGLPLGHRKRLLKSIRERFSAESTARAAPTAEPAPDHPTAAAVGRNAQRRHLTLIFVDLVDSTSLAHRLDPEELAEVLHAFYVACDRVVTRFGGHVAKHLGDGFVAYFGWPEAHEDDAERSVLAGLELVRTAATIAPAAGEPLQVRVGIASGDVVVGEVSGAASEGVEDVFGETPNLAARLQALAAPGAVLVSATTYQLVRHKFVFVALGAKELKGFRTAAQVYQVVGPQLLASDFEARRAAGLAPLVGRSAEVELLKSRWRHAAAGEGQVVVLIGEPGIGKSRLSAELQTSIADQGIATIAFQCSALHSDSPFYPVARTVVQGSGLTDADAPDVKRQKLQRLFQLEDDAPELSLLAAHMLIDIGQGRDEGGMSPERQRNTIYAMLAAFILRRAEHAPLLVTFEDTHWADPTTSEFLEVLIAAIQKHPVLLLLTSRPVASIPWRASHQTVLTLSGLSRGDGALLAEAVAREGKLSQELIATIAERADGNPFYIEELAAAVSTSDGSDTDRSDAQAVRAIPATLQDSLLARIDRASARAKELGQLCAVLGRRFLHEHISAIYPAGEEELDRALAELVEHGLLQQTGRPPQAEYFFRHALIQDAAYAIILLGKRRQLHAACARALEERFPLLCQNDPGTLGHHHEAAGNLQAAVPYFLAAGQLAVERFALREAGSYLQRGLTILDALEDSPWKQEQELRFRTLHGRVCIFAKGWADPSVKAEYDRALSLCKSLGLVQERVSLEWALTTYHLLRGEIQEAVAGGDRVLALAEETTDEGSLSVAHSALTIYRFYNGDFLGAIWHKDQALRFYKEQTSRELQQSFGTDRRLQALRGAALAQWCLGDHQSAVDLDEEQRLLAARGGRPFERAYALTISCILHALRREGELTLALAEEAIAIAAEQGFRFLEANAGNFRALASALLEPSDAALAHCETAIGNFRASGNRMGISSMLAIMGDVCGRIGEYARGLEYVEAALRYVAESGERFAESDLHRVRGDLFTGQGQQDKARECFEFALSVARQQSANTWALAAAIPLARSYGDAGRARSLLEPLYDNLRRSRHISGQLHDAKAILGDVAA